MRREYAKDSRYWMEDVVGFNAVAFSARKLMAHIDKIYDDIEARVCGNCIYYDDINESSGLCENMALPPLGVNKDFGCNKFERR